MKRLLTIGLMLASAFALTNCVEQEQLPENDKDIITEESTDKENTENEEFSIPFEVYASAAETKTANDENDDDNTVWVAGDAIHVFHAVADTKKYNHNSKFTIKVIDDGLFGGALTSPLEAGASYDWYFLYPYSSTSGTSPSPDAMPVTIGSAADGYQTQIGASKKDHIAEVNCPLYGKKMGVAAETNPKIQMKHLSALLAIKLVNETGNPVTIEHIAVESTTNPIVGKFNANFVGDTPVVTKTQAESESSKMAILVPYQDANTSDPGITIAAGTEAPAFEKFYMAVAPTTDKFTVYVNGTPITKDVSIELAAGKVTTIKVNIPAIQGTLTSNTTKDGTNFVTWDANTIANTKTGSINGITGINIYSVNNGLITIKGTLAEFLGATADDCALPISFYAASKVNIDENVLSINTSQLSIGSINAYKSIKIEIPWIVGWEEKWGIQIPIWGKRVLFDKNVDMTFTGEELEEKFKEKGSNIPVSFTPEPVGCFTTDNSNLIVLTEKDNNYYLSEAKANTLIAGVLKDTGITFTLATLRSAIFERDVDAWNTIFQLAKILAPGQFKETNGKDADTELGSLLRLMVEDENAEAIRAVACPLLQTAELTVKLQTTRDVALWGMNVQSPDTDIN